MLSAEQLRARAIKMQALLEDSDIQEGFETVEAAITAEWRRCQDQGERDNLWRALNIMDRLQTYMRSAASYDLTAIRQTALRRSK